MADITQLLESAQAGESGAAEKLLPLVYQELRRLASAKMARQLPGQTLQATALVHEAWMKLSQRPDKAFGPVFRQMRSATSRQMTKL